MYIVVEYSQWSWTGVLPDSLWWDQNSGCGSFPQQHALAKPSLFRCHVTAGRKLNLNGACLTLLVSLSQE